MPGLDFWFEFASTYSYPAAMRIEALAGAKGVAVRWRPFLLGPLFAAQGWRDSPFNIYPVKGRYMWRDLERVCLGLKLPLQRPDPFPQNSLLAARVALTLPEPLRAPFSRAVYAAQFGQGRSIADRAVIAELIAALGEDAAPILARAESPDNKAALKAACEEAARLGLPGAPACVAEDGEVFWGNDRLEQAVEWAVSAVGSRQSAVGSRQLRRDERPSYCSHRSRLPTADCRAPCSAPSNASSTRSARMTKPCRRRASAPITGAIAGRSGR